MFLTKTSNNNYPEYAGKGNPADVFCEQNGGTVQIITDVGYKKSVTIIPGTTTGKQIGMCSFFDEYSFCEEQAYMKGECTPERPTEK